MTECSGGQLLHFERTLKPLRGLASKRLFVSDSKRDVPLGN